MTGLKGKTAIVTGAASGIGRTVAVGLARVGAQVWLADIDADGIRSVTSECGEYARALPVDLADCADIAAAVEKVEGAGGAELLINAAGTCDIEPWLSLTQESFDRIFSVNARGMAFLTQAVVTMMIARGRGGVIVNVASIGGRRGDPGGVAYSASKAAVISLTQSAAVAFAPHGIRVNCIAPGPVLTPMYHEVQRLREARLGQAADQMLSKVPLGRASTPEEQAQAVLFLLSDESAYVTGQTLNVDGGLFPS